MKHRALKFCLRPSSIKGSFAIVQRFRHQVKTQLCVESHFPIWDSFDFFWKERKNCLEDSRPLGFDLYVWKDFFAWASDRDSIRIDKQVAGKASQKPAKTLFLQRVSVRDKSSSYFRPETSWLFTTSWHQKEQKTSFTEHGTTMAN